MSIVGVEGDDATMGYGLRYFIAEDNGVLTRVPAVKCHRWLADDEAVPAERAARELKVLEVVVEDGRPGSSAALEARVEQVAERIAEHVVKGLDTATRAVL